MTQDDLARASPDCGEVNALSPPLGTNPKPAAIPDEDLQPIVLGVAEQAGAAQRVTTIDPGPDCSALRTLAHVGDSGGQIDPCGWTQSKHGLHRSSTLTRRANVLVSKPGCTSIRRPPGSTTASPQLGSCCFGDFLAANSTGTKRPAEEIGLRLLFQRSFFRWRSSVLKLKPRLWQNYKPVSG